MCLNHRQEESHVQKDDLAFRHSMQSHYGDHIFATTCSCADLPTAMS